MSWLLIFALTLMAAVLLSEWAGRSLFSTSVLFLAVGFLVGPSGFGWLVPTPDQPWVRGVAELALFSILFTDGMRVDVREWRTWALPGRALAIGLPLTLLLTAGLARLLIGMPWLHALLLGAALSPTDPVFASAIVGQKRVPERLRRLLNIESGMNDGLALPMVLILLDWVGSGHVTPASIATELGLGVLIGVAVPLAALWLMKQRPFGATSTYRPLALFSVGLTVLALAEASHGNLFLAAFSAGIVVGSSDVTAQDDFEQLGETVAELLKLAALLVFGALLTADLFVHASFQSYALAVLALVLARPLALAVALWGGGLSRREWLTAAWFGPKGFASVVYGLLIWRSSLPEGRLLFGLLALVVTCSIVAHASTDVLVARGFAPVPDDDPDSADPTLLL